jgi:hypothetical protein
VTVSGITFPQYSLYIYTLNDVPRKGETTVGNTTYYGMSPSPGAAGYVDSNALTPYTYNRIISVDPLDPTPLGNYVLVEGLTSASISFSQFATGDGFLSGFQLVAVPEPSSMLTVFSGSAVLLGLRRRRL